MNMVMSGIRQDLAAWYLSRFLPPKIRQLYWEATEAFRNHTYTACEAMCGVIVVEVAVDKGSLRKDTFSKMKERLFECGYLNMARKAMVATTITNRHMGAHRGILATKERARTTLVFTECILVSIYMETWWNRTLKFFGPLTYSI